MPLFHRTPLFLASLAAASCGGPGTSAAPGTASPAIAYYPPPGEEWARRRPAEQGFDSAGLSIAVRFAQASEIAWSMDMKSQLATNTAREPYPDILGPFKDRDHQNGVIIRPGSIVTEWGGVWASTRDHARFGYLLLRRGRWRNRQLLSEKWVTLATTPTPIRPVYGILWWLNTDQKQYPAATPRSFFALGAGGNVSIEGTGR